MTDDEFKQRFAKERIQAYLEIRDKAAERISRIERDGWRFFLGVGTEPMTDVTDDMERRDRETVAAMERLMELYEGDLG